MSSSPFHLFAGLQDMLQTSTKEKLAKKVENSLMYAKSNDQNSKEDKVVQSQRTSPAPKKSKKVRRLVVNQDIQTSSKLPLITNPTKKDKETLNTSNQNKSLSRIGHKRRKTEQYREQCVLRDKDKHPLKYKIVAQHIGLKDQKVYGLKQADFLQIQNQYLKNKGLENLREGCRQGVRKSASVRSPNFNSYIHKIFQHETASHTRSSRSLHRYDLNQTQKKLIARQEKLGKLVFQRVKAHLQKQKERPNFSNRLKTTSAIDSALVHHIQTKIKRAQSLMKK